jgi:cyclic pyranopterin phosphate synthase
MRYFGAMKPLIDSFGRVVTNLRISITDRCNFRCRYCMPEEGVKWMARQNILTFEEIVRLAKVFIGLGIEKIRLTGGEPTLRKDLPQLVAMIAPLPGLRDLGLTTNGYLLKELSGELYRAGLRRINVSLDSLSPARFNDMARRPAYEKVMAGLDELAKYPIRPVKINTVIMKGFNDDEVLPLVEFARTREYQVRFIEFMPLDGEGVWSRDKVMSTQEILDVVRSRYLVFPKETRANHVPADTYVFADGRGEIGFISSVSEPFCYSCNRVRLTADGHFRTCLFSLQETDLKTPMRNGTTDAELARMIREAVRQKEEGHQINLATFVKPERNMSQIGG